MTSPLARLLLASAAFLFSGAAGLVYQVAWQRILALHSGVGIYSIAMIVAAFLAGLGLGSHLGGSLSTRVDPRRSLLAFAVVELLIAAFGAASCYLYYDVLYLKGSWLYASAWRAGILHFAVLILPTGLMGMSLPFVVRGLVRDTDAAGRTVGVLYGINLLGASLGALLAPWVLIRYYGIGGAVLWAAAGNLAAGVIGLTVAAIRDGDVAAPRSVRAEHEEERQPFALWLALYALSGFVALSLEILWFRVVEVAVKATAFTFGTVLCLYLAGSAAGCLVGARVVGRMRRPLRAFLLCQCVLIAYSGLALALLGLLPVDTPGYDWFYRFWRSAGIKLGQGADPKAVLRLYLAFPLALFGLPTVLMGLSFPALQRAVHDDPLTTGRKVGALQAANIAGCVAGSLLIGLLGLSWVGSTGAMRLLMLVGLIFCLTGMRRDGVRSVFGALAAALVVLAIAHPGQRRFWLRLHATDSPVALLDEDATGVGALIPRNPGTWVVYVTGKGHSSLPFGGIHTQLGAVPAIVHGAPLDVAIIGLGSGDTAWAAGCRKETQSVTVFEISGAEPRLLARLATSEDFPDLRRFLADPRVQVVVADGRNAVTQGRKAYDVIEADALWPEVAYAGNLYSVEFFRACAAKLKPGGILCTWAPTNRVYASFTEVMPHVIGVGDRSVLLGSNEPLPLDIDAWRARLHSEPLAAYLGAKAVESARSLLERLQPLHVTGRRHRGREMNFDLFPRDEFLSP